MRVSALVLLACGTGACGIDEAVHKKALEKLRHTELELNDVEAQLEDSRQRSAHTRARLDAAETERGSLAEKLGATKKEIEELRRAREAADRRNATYRKLVSLLQSMIDSGQLIVEIRKGKMIVKLANQILFDPGKTEIKAEGQEALQRLSAALRDIPDRDFLVTGHTDNKPIRSKRFKSNWELSTARAVEVVRYMQAEGVNPERLGAAGYSEFDPVAGNDTDGGRRQNRRIEVVLMPNIEELPSIDLEQR